MFLKINHAFQNNVKFSSFTFVCEKVVNFFLEVIVVIHLIELSPVSREK